MLASAPFGMKILDRLWLSFLLFWVALLFCPTFRNFRDAFTSFSLNKHKFIFLAHKTAWACNLERYATHASKPDSKIIRRVVSVMDKLWKVMKWPMECGDRGYGTCENRKIQKSFIACGIWQVFVMVSILWSGTDRWNLDINKTGCWDSVWIQKKRGCWGSVWHHGDKFTHVLKVNKHNRKAKPKIKNLNHSALETDQNLCCKLVFNLNKFGNIVIFGQITHFVSPPHCCINTHKS